MEAGVVQDDGTTWIFYYNISNHLSYTTISPDGSSVRKTVELDGKVQTGNGRALAAARYDNGVSLVSYIYVPHQSVLINRNELEYSEFNIISLF